MNVFDIGRERRIAALVTSEYPAVNKAQVYRELDELAAATASTVRVFHVTATDPGGLDAQLRARVGHGFLVMRNRLMFADAAEHFRYGLPEPFARLVHDIRRELNGSEAEILLRPEMQAALGHARWLQAWAPDAICSYYLDQQSLFAFVASRLLGLPWVLHLHGNLGNGAYAAFLPGFVAHASIVVPGSAAVMQELVGRCGESVRAKCAMRTPPPGIPALHDSLARVITTRQPGNSASLGPTAAFTTRKPTPSHDRVAARSFVVIGAERTGSNLLMGLLADQKRVACAGELFNQRLMQNAEVPWFGNYNGAELHRLRMAGPVPLHQRLVTDGAARGARWVGFKLLYQQALFDYRILDYLLSLEDLTVIHLKRSDRLRRLLSHRVADLTDSWFATPTKAATLPAGPVKLDAAEVATDFAGLEIMEHLYERLFAGRRTLELEYDSFVSDLRYTGEQLAELLSIDIQHMRPRTTKTGSPSLSTSIAGYDQLCASFVGTRWQQQLPSVAARHRDS